MTLAALALTFLQRWSKVDGVKYKSDAQHVASWGRLAAAKPSPPMGMGEPEEGPNDFTMTCSEMVVPCP